MRVFTVGELHGSLRCEHKSKRGKRCGKECWSLLLTKEENALLPVKLGPDAVQFVFKNKLGQVCCGPHLEKAIGALEAAGERMEVSELSDEQRPHSPSLSINMVWCKTCERGVGDDECDIEEAPEEGDEVWKITHRVCRKTFVAHKRDFYRRDGGRPPHQRNPFVPLHISF